MIKKLVSVIIALIVCAPSLWGYGSGFEGTRGGQALRISGGAAGPAMGGAYTAAGSDISGVDWNPAAATGITGGQFELMRLEWFGGAAVNRGAIGIETGAGTLGVSYAGITVEGLERRAGDTVAHEGRFRSEDSVGRLFYALGAECFSAGAVLKYIYSKIEDESASAFALDIGAQAVTGRLKKGIAVRNIGTKMKYIDEADSLPLEVSAGLQYRFTEVISAAADVNFPSDGELNAAFGAEYLLTAGAFVIPLRAGIRAGAGGKFLESVAAGGGVTYSGYSFEFAWVPYGDLGDTFRVSIKGGF